MYGGIEQVVITGVNQLLLSIVLFIYPEATAGQLYGFIHTNGG